ncbi:MAG TPA: hypothetical protein VJH88_06305 [Candidatus Nanoarchaeia archaeon]|nr:hypothetical protein [Candidatus Nanoarchaeia archaeon]
MELFANKKAQLGWIEFKFFLGGLIVGLIGAVILAILSCSAKVLPAVGFICG